VGTLFIACSEWLHLWLIWHGHRILG
jgi:hypothetical protein